MHDTNVINNKTKRVYHQPYENLVFTGITTKRVEAMEKTLKKDAEKECSKFENKLLIHSESDTGNLEAEWEEVSSDKIKTCYEAYCAAFTGATSTNPNIECIYHRLPVTDERAPAPLIVDTFVALFESNPSDSIFIFNCQMGRGRTTTGMIIYALWKRKCKLCQIESVDNETKNEKKKSKNALVEGEYNAVLDLLRILPQGKEAKKWCDEVIDALSHMQNLRMAIFQMQLRANKAVSDKSKSLIQERAQNYLQRYSLLIAFSSYLLNDYENESEDRVTFGNWLGKRGAVTNCIYSASIEE